MPQPILFKDRASVYRLDLMETACKNIYRPLSGAGLTYPMMEKEIRHLRAAAEVLLRMQKRGEQSEGVDLLDHDVVAFPLERLRKLPGPEIEITWSIRDTYFKAKKQPTGGVAAATADAAPAPAAGADPAATDPDVLAARPTPSWSCTTPAGPQPPPTKPLRRNHPALRLLCPALTQPPASASGPTGRRVDREEEEEDDDGKEGGRVDTGVEGGPVRTKRRIGRR